MIHGCFLLCSFRSILASLSRGRDDKKSNLQALTTKMSVHAAFAEGSLEVKLPTIWTDEKQGWGGSEKRREEEKKSKKRKSEEEDPGPWKGKNVTIHWLFPMICGSGGSKSRLAKAASAEPPDELHAVAARSTCPSQNAQNTSASEHSWKLRCRKNARAVVAQSAFPSQHVQNTPASEHFWKLRFRKKCTSLWREEHFQATSAKKWQVWVTFGRSDVVSRGWRKGLCTLSKVSKNVKTKQICEISFKMESWVQSCASAFWDFSTPSVSSAAPATQQWCQIIRSGAPVTQNHLRKPEDPMLSRNQPLTS